MLVSSSVRYTSIKVAVCAATLALLSNFAFAAVGFDIGKSSIDIFDPKGTYTAGTSVPFRGKVKLVFYRFGNVSGTEKATGQGHVGYLGASGDIVVASSAEKTKTWQPGTTGEYTYSVSLSAKKRFDDAITSSAFCKGAYVINSTGTRVVLKRSTFAVVK